MPPSPLTTGLPSLFRRPLRIYSHLLGHLPRHTTGTPLRPLCLTVFLAEVGISLEMRQLTSRQPAGIEPEAQASRMREEPGEKSGVEKPSSWCPGLGQPCFWLLWPLVVESLPAWG